MMKQSEVNKTYVAFLPHPSSPARTTDVWDVVQSGAHKNQLGSVRWFGRWRCYAFFPFPASVFEKKCLRDIADFCDTQTKVWRDHQAAMKK